MLFFVNLTRDVFAGGKVLEKGLERYLIDKSSPTLVNLRIHPSSGKLPLVLGFKEPEADCFRGKYQPIKETIKMKKNHVFPRISEVLWIWQSMTSNLSPVPLLQGHNIGKISVSAIFDDSQDQRPLRYERNVLRSRIPL